MKICMIVPSLDRKGPVIVATALSNWYALNGHDVDLYYIKENEIKVDLNGKINIIKFGFDFINNLKTYDVIHSNSFFPDLINRLCVLLSKKTKHVTTVHNYMKLDFKMDYNPLVAVILGTVWPWLIKDINRVYISKSQQDFLETEYFINKPYAKNIQIYNPVIIDKKEEVKTESVERFIRKAKEADNKLIGVCSVLTKRKAVNTVIDAFSYLPENYYLVIIGDGPEKDTLCEMVSKNKLSDKICFSGFIERPYTIMKDLDLYIFPSEVEAFGLSGIEAGMLDIPLVVSDITTFRELYSDDTASFFNVGDYRGLANEIIGYETKVDIEPCALANKMISRFSIEVVGNKYLEFYHE